MSKPSPRVFCGLLAVYLAAALFGCIAGAAADGVGSIWPNFARYGLGVGAGIAAVLAFAYRYDLRAYRRRLNRQGRK